MAARERKERKEGSRGDGIAAWWLAVAAASRGGVGAALRGRRSRAVLLPLPTSFSEQETILLVPKGRQIVAQA